ncbi:hypothetical protein MRB53_041012 [Persea americana]|nr:hypothetical protein MRB53_041012 [Persea americana]
MRCSHWAIGTFVAQLFSYSRGLSRVRIMRSALRGDNAANAFWEVSAQLTNRVGCEDRNAAYVYPLTTGIPRCADQWAVFIDQHCAREVEELTKARNKRGIVNRDKRTSKTLSLKLTLLTTKQVPETVYQNFIIVAGTGISCSNVCVLPLLASSTVLSRSLRRADRHPLPVDSAAKEVQWYCVIHDYAIVIRSTHIIYACSDASRCQSTHDIPPTPFVVNHI